MNKEAEAHIYNGILLSHMIEWSNTFAVPWVDLQVVILSEESQKEEDKHLCSHLYVESKMWPKWTYLWNRNRLTNIENRRHCPKGGRAGEVKDWEFGISRCKLLYIGWIKNKVFLYSTGNYIQYLVANHNGKEYGNRKEKKKPAVASR